MIFMPCVFRFVLAPSAVEVGFGTLAECVTVAVFVLNCVTVLRGRVFVTVTCGRVSVAVTTTVVGTMIGTVFISGVLVASVKIASADTASTAINV